MKKIVFILLLLVLSTSTMMSENYAILISAGHTTTDDVVLHSEYWYDLFLAYEDLILNEGYTHKNVIVFFGGGNDFVSIYPRFNKSLYGWVDPIVDFDNDYNTMYTEFGSLGNMITPEDNVLIRWCVGHGGTSGGSDEYSASIENHNQTISENQLYGMMNQIDQYARRKILWMTCMSGCLVHGYDNFNNDKTVIITSSNWNELSWAMWSNGLPHAEFNYVVTSALFGEDASGTSFYADGNHDNEISMEELFIFADNSSYMSSDPQLGDYCQRAVGTFIDEVIELYGANITYKISYEVDAIRASDYRVNASGGDVIFAATNGIIRLDEGFQVDIGASFKAQNGTVVCGNFKSTKIYPGMAENSNSNNLQFTMGELNFADHSPLDFNVELFPNPTRDYLFINVLGKIDLPLNIEMYNSSGVKINSKEITNHKYEINLTNYPVGIYFVKIQNKSGITTKKIIKD